MNQTWLETIERITFAGDVVKPRGKHTLELPSNKVVVDMRKPVLTVPERRLSYRFMAAEAYWILSGDNTVASIAPWNEHIKEFSDNGQTFFGAYGPKVVSQIDYVVRALTSDRDTRQAVMTIWRENPPQTKDFPCTIAITAMIRNGYLNLHVFMRSSDAWLGLPYDAFNFSMLAHLICAKYNGKPSASLTEGIDQIQPGNLYLTSASSHLYGSNAKAVQDILKAYAGNPVIWTQKPTPEYLFKDERRLMESLRVLRETSPGDQQRWWEHAA